MRLTFFFVAALSCAGCITPLSQRDGAAASRSETPARAPAKVADLQPTDWPSFVDDVYQASKRVAETMMRSPSPDATSVQRDDWKKSVEAKARKELQRFVGQEVYCRATISDIEPARDRRPTAGAGDVTLVCQVGKDHVEPGRIFLYLYTTDRQLAKLDRGATVTIRASLTGLEFEQDFLRTIGEGTCSQAPNDNYQSPK